MLMENDDATYGELAVALSSLLPASSDETWGDCARFEAAYKKLGGNSAPETAEFLAQIDEEFEEFAPILDMATPSKTLVQCYQDAVATTA